MNRRIALVGLAIVLALVGTFMVYNYAHNADKRALAGTHTADVLVVAKRVPAGTTWSNVLRGNYLSNDKVPVDAAPSSAIARLDAAVPGAQVASADIAAGQIVLRPMFGEKTVTTGILKIPAGKVAMSINLPANANVAGFVQNGSQVAVFATSWISGSGTRVRTENPANPPNDALFRTKLLLARADVIATSQGSPADLSGAKAANTNGSTSSIYVTLAVSQADAERLILSQTSGQLYLALLSATSVTAPDGGTVNLDPNFKPTPVFTK